MRDFVGSNWGAQLGMRVSLLICCLACGACVSSVIRLERQDDPFLPPSAYSIEIFDDGLVRFQGSDGTLIQGSRQVYISPDSVAMFLKEAEWRELRTMLGHYRKENDVRLSTRVLSISTDELKKVIRAEDGEPDGLIAFERHIHRAIRSVKWLGSYRDWFRIDSIGWPNATFPGSDSLLRLLRHLDSLSLYSVLVHCHATMETAIDCWISNYLQKFTPVGAYDQTSQSVYALRERQRISDAQDFIEPYPGSHSDRAIAMRRDLIECVEDSSSGRHRYPVSTLTISGVRFPDVDGLTQAMVELTHAMRMAGDSDESDEESAYSRMLHSRLWSSFDRFLTNSVKETIRDVIATTRLLEQAEKTDSENRALANRVREEWDRRFRKYLGATRDSLVAASRRFYLDASDSVLDGIRPRW